MRKHISILALLGLYISAFGQSQSDTLRYNVNAKQIAIWADSIIKVGMKEHHIPGAAFVFIHGDSIHYAKGYGFANLDDSTPVDPFKTHFDMGSIPKSLTTVAALQLEESGKLDLHLPAHKWAPYFSNSQYPQPTLHQLLTHTAGLDDLSNIGSATKSLDAVPDLDQFIKSIPPIQVIPPGKIISYSNLGYAIIGRMMESASGISFPDYMHQNLLKPLEMRHSSFRPKLTAEMESHRALGYEFIDGNYIAAPVNYQFNGPAAGLRSTAGDMANFIKLLLNDGQFKNRQLISNEMINEMQSLQFSNHPNLQGLGYSLREEYYNGHRIMAQNGGWQGFNHDFYLIKELGIGFMILLNADDGSQVGNTLIESFTKKFIEPKESINHPLRNLTNSEEYDGVYRSNRYSRHKITKFGVLLGAISELEINSVGDSLFYYGTPLLYEGNDVFRRADGGGQIAFLRDSKGRVDTMVRSYSHYDANEKLNWYETSNFQRMLYLAIAFTQILIIVFSIIHILRRRKQMNKLLKISLTTQLTSTLLPIAFVIGLMIEFTSVGAWDFQYGATTTLKIWLTVPFTLILLLVYMIYFFKKSFMSFISTGAKLQYGISIFTLLVFLAFLHHWNFIGFKF